MNFKLINFMSINFVNKQISYFFPLRCFLNLIKFMLMNFKLINFMLINFKLINFMSMNFVNKQISYFFPLRCFLMLFWCFFVLVKSYHKKKEVLNWPDNFNYNTTKVSLLQDVLIIINNNHH